jgi:hypothetical protein
MLDPGEPLLVADLQHVCEIAPNTRQDKRVRAVGLRGNSSTQGILPRSTIQQADSMKNQTSVQLAGLP